MSVDIDPNSITGAIDNGPTTEPIPPSKIKSPPPIPSLSLNNLYIKFIDQRKKYPKRILTPF